MSNQQDVDVIRDAGLQIMEICEKEDLTAAQVMVMFGMIIASILDASDIPKNLKNIRASLDINNERILEILQDLGWK